MFINKKLKMLLASVLSVLFFCFLVLTNLQAINVDESVSSKQELQNAIINAASTENVYVVEVVKDIVIDSELIIPANARVMIISAADQTHKITTSATSGQLFTVNGSLTLENIIIDGNSSISGIKVSGGAITLNDRAVITNCKANGAGSGVGVSLYQKSTFTMNGGEIYANISNSNYGSSGGGVSLNEGSTGVMNGGSIHDNVNTIGGGVIVAKDSYFTMNDGEIYGNVAGPQGYGGGVAVGLYGTFEMNGGRIHDNMVKANVGGGVSVGQSSWATNQTTPPYWSNFIMNGGVIENNHADDLYGGGLAIAWTGNVTMNGGMIRNNTALAGGGVVIGLPYDNATPVTFFMNGGEITDNQATAYYGGGIMVLGPEPNIGVKIGTVASISQPIIKNNKAAMQGGGIYLFQSKVSLFNALLTGNEAGSDGGGIYLSADSSLNIAQNTIFENNVAANNGGAIYTGNVTDYANLTAQDYQNLTVDKSTMFKSNSAVSAYEAPEIASSYTNIQYAVTSLQANDNTFINPINNYDINYVGTEKLVFYTLTYDANGGSGSYVEKNVAGNKNIIKSLAAVGISNDGYELLGWNTKADGSGKKYQVGDAIVIEDNITLYAQWQKKATPLNTYVVLYQANGGTGDYKSEKITAGNKYFILDADQIGIKRTGYIFNGWNTKADGSGKAYQVQDQIVINNNIVLYAQWLKDDSDKKLSVAGKAAKPLLLSLMLTSLVGLVGIATTRKL